MNTCKYIVTSLIVLLLMACCQPKQPDYKKKLNVAIDPYSVAFDRYEEVLFNLDTFDFQHALMEIQPQYSVFLGGDLNNPEAVRYLKDFATDPFSLVLYDRVKAAFPDLSQVKPLVEEVFARFHSYYPEVQLPSKVFTCVTGVTADVPAIQIFGDEMVVSLDWYLNDEEIYDAIGMPKYMALRRTLLTLPKDVAKELFMNYVNQWRKQGQIVDEMVYCGLIDFFVEAMCPAMSDSVLLGYSTPQWQWAVDNEGPVWADLVGSRRLYDSSLDSYMMLFGDGPFTQAYSNEAPSRLGEFFGLNVIRSYVATHDDFDLKKLMQRKDYQIIFQDSGYKPKK